MQPYVQRYPRTVLYAFYLLGLLRMSISQQLEKVVEVIHVPDLARYRHTLCITCSYLSIIDQCIFRVIDYLLCVVVVRIQLSLVAFEDKVATNHHSSPSFTCFAVNCNNIFLILA